MAIKVNGTTVINDSRALSNIASVDATTAAAIGAAGVGGGSAPEPPDWASPTTTLTSSQTWTKPGSIGNDDWVVFYAIGGGAAWANVSYKNGGSGGSAAVFAIKGSAIPSTVAIVVGAGGSGGSVDGGDTTMTFGSTVFVASGGVITGGGSLVEPPVGVFSMNSDGSDLDVALGTGLTAQGGGAGGDTLGLDISSTWGGAAEPALVSAGQWPEPAALLFMPEMVVMAVQPQQMAATPAAGLEADTTAPPTQTLLGAMVTCVFIMAIDRKGVQA